MNISNIIKILLMKNKLSLMPKVYIRD